MNKRVRVRKAICLVLVAISGLARVSSAPTPPVQFSFVCARPSVTLSPEHQRLVSTLMRQHVHEGVKAWGDRAVRISTGSSGGPIYFVPLSCGATGNCIWAVLASTPARSLGTVEGSVVHLRQTHDPWPTIEGFSGYGTGEGDLSTYQFREGGFRRIEVGKLTPEAVDRFESCVDNESCCPRPAT